MPCTSVEALRSVLRATNVSTPAVLSAGWAVPMRQLMTPMAKPTVHACDCHFHVVNWKCSHAPAARLAGCPIHQHARVLPVPLVRRRQHGRGQRAQSGERLPCRHATWQVQTRDGALEVPAGASDPSALEARIRALPFPAAAEPATPKASVAPPADAVIFLFEKTRTRRNQQSRAVIQRIAAVIILSVAVTSGWMLGRVDNGARDGAVLAVGTVPKGTPVARLLESQPSGTPVESLVVAATMRDGRGRPCREIEFLEQGRVERPLVAAIACRQAVECRRSGAYRCPGDDRVWLHALGHRRERCDGLAGAHAWRATGDVRATGTSPDRVRLELAGRAVNRDKTRATAVHGADDTDAFESRLARAARQPDGRRQVGRRRRPV